MMLTILPEVEFNTLSSSPVFVLTGRLLPSLGLCLASRRRMNMRADEVYKMFTDFKNEIMGEIRGIKEGLSSIGGISEQIKAVEDSVTTKMQVFEEKLDKLENYSRRSNLIVYGLKEEPSEDVEVKVKDMFKHELSYREEIRFERVHRLGKKQQNRSRPIICRFSFFQQKSDIMKRAGSLKGKHISMSNDFSQAVRDRRRILVPHLKYQRHNGKKARLDADRLFIEGVMYVVNGNNQVINNRSGALLQMEAEPDH